MGQDEELKKLSDEEYEYNLLISRELRGLPNSFEKLEKYKLNFQKSFEPKKAKRKKIVLTTAGKKFVAGATLATIVGAGAVCAFVHSPKYIHGKEIEEANRYISENIMPRLLEQNGVETISPDGEISYNLSLSIDDIRKLQDAIASELNITPDDAQYVVFEYYNFADELFAQYGYEDAYQFCYENGYKSKDPIDGIIADPVTIYENMHEQAIIDAIRIYKDEMGTR